ncbi:hypothetical protein BEL04_14025 [Mucilaginibacter sp. PPCGB 2223]|nr:hypothetical protein BEL04_14025 [Mucilaginibacter sp. PPCGB 2223]
MSYLASHSPGQVQKKRSSFPAYFLQSFFTSRIIVVRRSDARLISFGRFICKFNLQIYKQKNLYNVIFETG